MNITDTEFALARRNNQTIDQANAIIGEAGERILALQKKLVKAQKALAASEAENAALRLQVMRLSR